MQAGGGNTKIRKQFIVWRLSIRLYFSPGKPLQPVPRAFLCPDPRLICEISGLPRSLPDTDASGKTKVNMLANLVDLTRRDGLQEQNC